jgi:hypothetical protein
MLAGIVMLAVLLIVPTASAADAAGGTGLGARPQASSSNTNQGYFDLDADPGAELAQVLVLTNLTGKPKTVRLASCDGAAAVYGGVTYSESDETPSAVGSWVRLSTAKVLVPAGGAVQVPFVVRVPKDVTTGFHLGGIAVWEPAAAKTSGVANDSGDKASTSITAITRVVLPVVVTTPGAETPGLTISGAKAEARSDGMYLVVAISSDGTALTSGQGAISLANDGFTGDITLGKMIPQSDTRYPVKWDADPAEGTYQAQVEVKYADGAKTATWAGPITVGSTEMEALGDRLLPTDTHAGASSTPWLMYGLIGGLIVIVLIMGFALLRRRRPEAR